ncbi:hypothetical protein ABTN75_20685, partial [Acinetobacter baumannii]
AERLALRLSPGTTWVSHLLQRLAHALLIDPAVRAQIDAAGAHYASRNAAFIARLADRGIVVPPSDGLNVWVTTDAAARPVAEGLM